MIPKNEFNARHPDLVQMPEYQEMMAKVFSPQLWEIITSYYDKYCLKTKSHMILFSQKVPLEELIFLREYDPLQFSTHTKSGRGLFGEVCLDINFEHGIHIEFFYAGNRSGDLVMTYVLNGDRTQNFDELLKWLSSQDYVRSRFPVGLVMYNSKNKK